MRDLAHVEITRSIACRENARSLKIISRDTPPHPKRPSANQRPTTMQLISHDLLLLYLSHPYIASLLPYFVYFGIASVFYVLFKSLAFALNWLIVSPIDWERVRKGVAVVSGATDGIGLEFVRELHARGVSVILLGRSSEKLQAVIESVKGEASSATLETHQIDFAEATKADWDAFRSKFVAAQSSGESSSRPPVTVLINCAGTSHEHPKFFSEETPVQIQQIISVNCSGALQLTRAILPSMLDNGFGIVWNVGSMSAEVASPLLQTYAASKSFLKTWSMALAVEVQSRGVHVELLNTYYVVRHVHAYVYRRRK